MSLRFGIGPLSGPDPLQLVDEVGGVEEDGDAWLGTASLEDHGVLVRAAGPVLDIGCGPGRHTQALKDLGVDVLGIDVTPSMLETATRRCAPVLAASVFGLLPRMGQWQTALTLDGNAGLGGDPVGLLRRLRRVLRPDGRILADLASGPAARSRRLRLRHGGRLGPRFSWAPLHVNDLDLVAKTAGFEVVDLWKREQRWFCELGPATPVSSPDSTPAAVTAAMRPPPPAGVAHRLAGTLAESVPALSQSYPALAGSLTRTGLA